MDLGAERFLGAERGQERIAVEVKSFTGASEVRDLELALGQFVLYATALQQLDPDRKLFLAVRRQVYREVFEEAIGRMLIDSGQVRLLVVNMAAREVERWIP